MTITILEDENLIKEGSHVIVYSSREQIDSILVKKEEQFQSRFGHFKHNNMIGLKFGSKYTSSNGRGFVYLLKATPELWTLALPHRTQILYLPDISFISTYLNIKSGSKVIEAGTGSGSFSHSIARSVGTKGKVHSFEFHEERFKKAQLEFKSHGLDDIITLKHQNVCKDGFEKLDEVDSVFLDVPAPWEAIAFAKIALRKDHQARICCFSPCIEQVLKTVTALTEQGFSDITMYETLTRTHDPAQYSNPPISSAIERIQAVEEKKSKRREAQIRDSQSRKVYRDLKRKADEIELEGEEAGPDRKKIALDDEGVEVGEVGEEEDAEMNSTTTISTSTTSISTDPLSIPPPMNEYKFSQRNNNNNNNNIPKPIPIPKTFTFKASAQSRGHTSYLTFATLLPTVFATVEAEIPPTIEIKATSEVVVKEKVEEVKGEPEVVV